MKWIGTDRDAYATISGLLAAEIGYSAVSRFSTIGRWPCFFKSSLNTSTHKDWSGTSSANASMRNARQRSGLIRVKMPYESNSPLHGVARCSLPINSRHILRT